MCTYSAIREEADPNPCQSFRTVGHVHGSRSTLVRSVDIYPWLRLWCLDGSLEGRVFSNLFGFLCSKFFQSPGLLLSLHPSLFKLLFATMNVRMSRFELLTTLLTYPWLLHRSYLIFLDYFSFLVISHLISFIFWRFALSRYL
jgi:hypothetical protein